MPSTKQLREAALNGDKKALGLLLDAAKAAGSKASSKTPRVRKPAAAATQSPAQPPQAAQQGPAQPDFYASTRPQGSAAPSRKITRDGVEHTVAQLAPVRPRTEPLKAIDPGGGLEIPMTKKAADKLKKMTAAPRTIPPREAAVRFEAQCDLCPRKAMIYASQMTQVVDESDHPTWVYICNRCSKKGR